MKRHGDMGIALIFALVCLIVITGFFSSSQRVINVSTNARREYVEYYNRVALGKIAMQYIVEVVSAQTVSVPITPLNSTIYSYVPALEKLTIPTEISASALLETMGNPVVSENLMPYFVNATIQITVSDFAPNYEHDNGRLYFKDGDILFLEPWEVSIGIKSKRRADKYTYEVGGMFCDISHIENNFIVRINDSEAVMY